MSLVPPKDHSGSVTPTEAMLVAQRHLRWASSNVPNFEDWKNAKLSQPVVYYFPNGTKSAYEFTVLVNGKPDGFILVAAQRYMPPVLEFSKGDAPSKRLSYARDMARKKGYSLKNQRLLYYGALTYSVQLDSNKLMRLTDFKVQPIPAHVHLALPHREENYLFKTNAKTSGVSILEDGGTDENLVSVVKSISGVPAWTSTDIRKFKHSLPI